MAWYCGLKLELYATCVLEYDDVFGVFEWGAGGIVHLHCPACAEGYGRYDTIDGQPPSDCASRAVTINICPSGT